MEGLLPLAVLIGASGTMLAFHRKARKEAQGFQDLIAPGVENAFGSAHANFVRKSAEKYNPISNLLNPLKNPIVAENATPAAITAAEKDVRATIQTAQARPSPTNYDLTASKVSDILLNKDAEGSGIRRIAMCERVKITDCSAFDDPNFSANCGICMDGGRDSGGNPMVGGLYSFEEDKTISEENAKRMNARRINYMPSVGTCAPFMFAANKQHCMKLKAQLECLRKQNFEVPGCSNCLQDEKFYYLQDGFIKSQPAIFLQGQGMAVLKRTGQKDKTFLLSTSPTRFELTGLDEGDVFSLAVKGEDSFVSGYLEGMTPSGSFRIDIIRLIQSDTITGARPRLSGGQDMNGENMVVMRPGRGKTEMNLAMLNPFTFIEPTEEEASQCASSPFVMKESSANFLDSSPCYKKGQGPGKYSLECLKQTFESAGCTAEGTGYPSTTERAQSLLVDGFGKVRSIGQIAQRIYETSVMAATGRTSMGQKLSIEQWSAESVFCTGKEIKSPCDVSDPKGNISTDCLDYLWQNAGAYQTIAGGPGQTYTNGLATTSLNEKDQNRYCTTDGTMTPVYKNGTINTEAVQAARSKGGIQQIKDFYDSIHKRANDNSLDIMERRDAILHCYGANVADTTGPQGLRLDIGDRNKYTSLLDNPAARDQSRYKYKGCWNDGGNYGPRTLPNFLGYIQNKQECEARAIAQGHDTFGLQFGKECWAGNGVDWKRAGESQTCNQFGNNMGGWHSQSVYSMRDESPRTPPVKLYEHCDGAGWTVELLPGEYDLTRNPNAFPGGASYIRTPAGVRATLYNGPMGQGRSKVVGPGQDWSFCAEGGWANDAIRSIRIELV